MNPESSLNRGSVERTCKQKEFFNEALFKEDSIIKI